MEHLGASVAAAPFPADPHRAHRLVLAAAAGAGDAGHRHGHAGAGIDQRAGDHLDHRLAADRPEGLQGLRAHAQHRLLGLVAVGGHAAVEPGRGAGDVGHGLGDPAAGAALGGDQAVALLVQALADRGGQLGQFGIGRRHGASRVRQVRSSIPDRRTRPDRARHRAMPRAFSV